MCAINQQNKHEEEKEQRRKKLGPGDYHGRRRAVEHQLLAEFPVNNRNRQSLPRSCVRERERGERSERILEKWK